MIFYDFEVFSNDWLCVLADIGRRTETVIINNPEELETFYKENRGKIWAGYNSKHYDQYILKGILCGFNPKEVNDYIIIDKKNGWEFSNLFRKIPLNNYDVMLPADGGLKSLEGFMGNSIRETSVPFDIDRRLTEDELQETVRYCRHDVEQTIQVFARRKEEFDSQMSLLKAFDLPMSYISKTKAQLSAVILGAVRSKSYDDEFELDFPDTLRIERYTEVLGWYKNPANRDYSKVLKVDVSGVPHVFAWGGLHGAVSKYAGEGHYINIDVASYYPALMIEYGFLSRNVSDPSKYRKIRDTRLKLKAEKNPMQAPYKIVLNSTYGAMKDMTNALYDPKQANNVCVSGQLLLLDLIERLEGHCQLIQSNTDGVLVKLFKPEDYDLIDDICFEWERRTRMNLEFEEFAKVYQKDVNNYVIMNAQGKHKSKGGYVKSLSELDYDLPIVNRAVVEMLLHGINPEITVTGDDRLVDFQKIVKVSGKYSHAVYNPKVELKKVRDAAGKPATVKEFTGGEAQTEKCFRVFASTRPEDGGIFKVKNAWKNPEKFANTPERCFIVNESVNGMPVPDYLDRKWYIDFAKKRLNDFGVDI